MTDFIKRTKRCKYIALLILIHLCSACNDSYENDQAVTGRTPLVIEGSIKQESVTRADDTGFADGDCMGVFVVDYANGNPGSLQDDNNRAENFALTYDASSGVWKGNSTIYWKDNQTHIDIYGYYPYESSIPNVTELPFSVASNQNLKPEGEMGAYEQSDFLWAKAENVAPTAETISLVYHHKMAGIKVSLTKGEGFEDGEWEELPRLVTVNNTLLHSTIDLSTGTVTPTGTEVRPIVMASEQNDNYRAVVIPNQTVAADKTVIGITLDGISYPFSKETNMVYTSGKMHHFTIEIAKKTSTGKYEVKLKSEEIKDWEDDESSHNFMLAAYVVVNVEKEGTLENCLKEKTANLKELKNLKITGKLTDEDFKFIRNNLPALAALNLRESKMTHVRTSKPQEADTYEDNALPSEAIYKLLTLRTFIFPENITRICSGALRETQLTGKLVIPNSVKRIDEYAFSYIGEENLEIVMPDSLEYIESNAFCHNEFKCELKLTNALRYIGDEAFYEAHHFHGYFRLPDKLEYLGKSAFYNLGNSQNEEQSTGEKLTGDIVIPKGLTKIPSKAFSNMKFTKGTTLTLHDGVTNIGEFAFSGLKFNVPIRFPESLSVVGKNAFMSCRVKGYLNLPKDLSFIGLGAFGGEVGSSGFEGELTLPDRISVINDMTFQGQTFTSINISENVTHINSLAFSNMKELRTITLAKNIDFIGEKAFGGCENVQTFVCLNPEPPSASDNSFDGMYLEKMVLEVPEEAISTYRNHPVWKKFKNITAHKELAFNLPEITCLHAEMSLSGVVRSQGKWVVKECPEWCTVFPQSGGEERREEVTVKVTPMSKNNGKRVKFSQAPPKSLWNTMACHLSAASHLKLPLHPAKEANR